MRQSDREWLSEASAAEKRRRHERYDRIKREQGKLLALAQAESERDHHVRGPESDR